MNAGYVPKSQRDLYMFMIAARWADDIRKKRQHDHPTWHYVSLPFKPAGQPDTLDAPAPDPDNILRAFPLNLAKVTSSDDNYAERAVALCWLFHLVGDVHQPLHCAALVTTNYPQGDRGGNLFYVRAKADGGPIGLHQFWDGLVVGTSRFQTARNKAIQLRNRDEFARERLTERTETRFDKWAAESHALAREVVYRNGDLRGSLNVSVVPALPEGYTERAKATAERRIVLAGYRLAAVLRKVFGEPEDR